MLANGERDKLKGEGGGHAEHEAEAEADAREDVSWYQAKSRDNKSRGGREDKGRRRPGRA